MSGWVELTAADGHKLSAYVAKPEGEAKGAVIVVQEIFGVNPSIQGVADHYARHGYVGIAPALFDRFGKNIQLGYGPEDMKKAFELYPQLDKDAALNDIVAAFEYVKDTGKGAAVLGFCYGGLMAWLSNTGGPALGMTPVCTVSYYGGGVGGFASEATSCPALLHFGADDDHIGKDQSDAVAAAHPDAEIFRYEGAGHAFANPDRPSYVASAAKLADERSLEFLEQNFS
ncbi:carboxymethylenebutenolidase [Bryocella elongata]|uniref:Carboxymethylenebutenolidase n=1 Tax=Bryocella elongata TaxID=863522 RepID=A0A1H5U7G4_9BACT|nr:dienelactone hydrolase family protein [Bryocella elongata]SEF70960.1 carboxymethylenebutenolidase [Bryocella elongata]